MLRGSCNWNAELVSLQFANSTIITDVEGNLLEMQSSQSNHPTVFMALFILDTVLESIPILGGKVGSALEKSSDFILFFCREANSRPQSQLRTTWSCWII